MLRLLLLTAFLTISFATPTLAQNAAKGTAAGKVKSVAIQGGTAKGKVKGSTVKPKTVKAKQGSGKPATTVAPKPLSYKPSAPPIMLRRTPTPLRSPSRGMPRKP